MGLTKKMHAKGDFQLFKLICSLKLVNVFSHNAKITRTKALNPINDDCEVIYFSTFFTVKRKLAREKFNNLLTFPQTMAAYFNLMSWWSNDTIKRKSLNDE